MSIILWGQYPRSEQLVQATRDWDRKRIDSEALQKIQANDRKELMKLQEGFHYLSTGQFHWEDLIRPLTHLSSTFSSGALTRFFETNTFWRTIEGDGEIDLKKTSDWIEDYFPQIIPDKTLYSFPFWFLFQHFSSGLLLDAFIPLFEHLPKGLLVFIEPCIGWQPISKSDKQQARNFLERLKKQVESPIVLATISQNIGKELDDLYSLPVDGIAIDFYRNAIEDVLPTFPKDKLLIAGIIDTDSALLEEKEILLQFKQQAETYIPKENLYFSYNAQAELLPRKVMDAKVRNLRESLQSQ